jgi:hypothetical protein
MLDELIAKLINGSREITNAEAGCRKWRAMPTINRALKRQESSAFEGSQESGPFRIAHGPERPHGRAASATMTQKPVVPVSDEAGRDCCIIF